MSVVVREFTGAVVAQGEFRRGDVVVAATLAAKEDHARFPLLAGVDQYDDTVFNALQCRRLVDELAALRHGLADDAAAAVDELGRLARLVIVDGPGQPAHRRLHFVGD